MLTLRSKYVAFLAMAFVLWAACGADLVGMYNSGRALPALAPIFRGHTGNAAASLMFNVDWGEEFLPEILDILEAKGAKATFFMTGSWAEKNSELATLISEKGHELGNHGGSHVHVETLAKKDLHDVIKMGEKRIFDSTGIKPAKLFAPPYGEWTDDTVNFALEIGYQTILWTTDTVDWQRPPPETIWKRALAGAKPGCLLLMHPTENTVIALPTIVDGYKEKGLALVTVSDNVMKKLGPVLPDS